MPPPITTTSTRPGSRVSLATGSIGGIMDHRPSGSRRKRSII
jgi:hypothetical protein